MHIKGARYKEFMMRRMIGSKIKGPPRMAVRGLAVAVFANGNLVEGRKIGKVLAHKTGYDVESRWKWYAIFPGLSI